MRVLAWNTSWNCGAERIARQNQAVREMAPDVAFFSEWSPRPSRTTSTGKAIRHSHHLRDEGLHEIGLVHQAHEHASDYEGRADGSWASLHWGILASSNTPISKAPVDNPTFAPGTWLEVQHEQSGLTLVSVRVPAWEGRRTALRRELWTWMLEQFERLRDTPALVLGDFNTEAAYGSVRDEQTHGADLLGSVTDSLSWTDLAACNGAAEPTFARKDGRTARIDYAFASPALPSAAIEFSAPTTIGRHHLVGERESAPLSDHTPVVLDVNTRPKSVALSISVKESAEPARADDVSSSDEAVYIPINSGQAAHLVPLLRDEGARLRDLGDRLIFDTNSRQAGFNSHDNARQLLALADLLDDRFPVDDYEDDEDDENTSGDWPLDSDYP